MERVAVTGRLILLCGLAGAGKTTVAKQLEADGAVRMCPDEWLVALGFDIYNKSAGLGRGSPVGALPSARPQRADSGRRMRGVAARSATCVERRHASTASGLTALLDAPVEVLTARVAERNRTPPDGAPRINPALVAFWNERIERPGAEELALFDQPAGRRQRG